MQICIDTSTRYASVAISKDGEIIVALSWKSGRNHSVELVDSLKLTMERASVTINELESVFVAKGPGAFSALRVGVSFAKALAMSCDASLIGVGTLDIEALPYCNTDKSVCATIGAGRNSFYIGTFAPGVSPLDCETEYRVVNIDAIYSVIEDGMVVCGEAAVAVKDALGTHGDRDDFSPGGYPPTRNPSALAAIGHSRLKRGETDSPYEFNPVYMRGSQIMGSQSANTNLVERK